MNISDFLDREKLEKSNLAQRVFLGGFFSLQLLRELRVRILRSRATALTNCSQDHQANQDEVKFKNQFFVGSFTKGLPHNDNGIADPEQFKRFRVAIHTGDFFSKLQPDLGRADFNWRAVTVGNNTPVRGWESPSAGLTFEMHGPDSHSVTMPPAPELGSEQLTFEMAEVYWLALLRDVHFKELQQGGSNATLLDAIKHLNALISWQNVPNNSPIFKRRKRQTDNGNLTPQNIFRGATPGDLVGPYLSQFLLVGTPGNENNPANIENGLIGYGTLKVNQKFVPAKPDLDHMTTWNVFLDVQDGANLKGFDRYESSPRFIAYLRDLANYVHFDALYEAYLNACLILLGFNAPVDSGIRQLNNLFSQEARDASAGELGRVDGFALFGGPHILNLVTEVSTRALKAVRYQKFNVHVRLRPEALAGWMEAINRGIGEIQNIGELNQMYNVLNTPQDGVNLLEQIRNHNALQNAASKDPDRDYLVNPEPDAATALLPMAFPEGSPMHPAYGAGHATVAGACVTMLKAFFDTSAVFAREHDGHLRIISRKDYDRGGFTPIAYIPDASGNSLEDIGDRLGDRPLTVGDELNKVAANISIGRNMAGVHYYTDYIDSLIMGEKVALGVLLEQSLAYEIYPNKVRPSFSLTTFLGRNLKIKDGEITENGQSVNWCDL